MNNKLDSMWRVYAWMVLSMIITGGTVSVLYAADMSSIFTNVYVLLVSVGIQLLLAISMALLIDRMSAIVAALSLIVFSIVTGVMVAAVIIHYSLPSITQSFILVAGVFAIMSIYALFTRRDFSGLGDFLTVSLFVVILVGVVGFVMHSSLMLCLVNIVFVFLFIGYTLYDTQQIKEVMQELQEADEDTKNKAAIIGALNLYLDILNMFLSVLSLLNDD